MVGERKDMEKCICTGTGYCELHRTHIDRKFDFLVCQGAHPQERERIHKKYQIKRKREEARKAHKQIMRKGKFITSSQLILDCINIIIPKLYPHKISGVIGIPRSGMIPASIIATHLSVPLYTIANEKVVLCSGSSSYGGIRMRGFSRMDGPLLVVDDTIFHGSALREAKRILPDEAEYIYAAVYSTLQKSSELDIYGELIDSGYFYEWCLFNCPVMNHSLLDIDGILCKDIPPEICRNPDPLVYSNYLSSIKPIPSRLPVLYHCEGLVTGRLENKREITEAWLAKHNVLYKRLHMYPSETEKERDGNGGNSHNNNVSRFKSDIFSKSAATIFIESNKMQAVGIAQQTQKMVICPEAGEVYGRKH